MKRRKWKWEWERDLVCYGVEGVKGNYCERMKLLHRKKGTLFIIIIILCLGEGENPGGRGSYLSRQAKGEGKLWAGTVSTSYSPILPLNRV